MIMLSCFFVILIKQQWPSISPENKSKDNGHCLGKAWLSTLRNDGTEQPRLMELRWLLIRAAVVINYLQTAQIFLYLGKVLIYLILFAAGSR